MARPVPIFLCTLGLLAVALLAWAPPATAQDEERERLFTVFGIAIDETAQNATLARQNGIAKAEEEAFRALIRRLVRPEDLIKFQMPEGTSASDFVLGIEVEEERRSRVRYISTVSIAFSPDEIEGFLSRLNIPFVGFAPDPVMIFPLFHKDGADLLWDERNLLFSVWREEANQNGLIRYVLPKGTLTERTALGAEQVLEGRQKEQILLALSDYGVSGYTAARARFTYSTRGEITGLGLTFFRPLDGLPPEERRYSPGPGETREAMLRRAIRDFYERAEVAWKAQALTQFGESREMALMVPVESPAVWAAVKSRLSQASIISDVTVARLATPETFITITFSGTDEQLALALRQKGLILFRAGRGFALIRQEDAGRYLAEGGGL